MISKPSSPPINTDQSLRYEISSNDNRIPSSGDEAYREILESCRHFYAFESQRTPFVQTQLLPRLEDSILLLEQKRKAKTSFFDGKPPNEGSKNMLLH